MNRQFFINNLWRWKCNIPEVVIEQKTINLKDLQKSEWNNKFETLMRNRLVFGAIRYGKIGESGKPKYSRIESIIKRLKNYNKTGNMEFLVDCANLCLLEFVENNHPTKHFSSIDDGEHVNTKD